MKEMLKWRQNCWTAALPILIILLFGLPAISLVAKGGIKGGIKGVPVGGAP